MRLTFIFSPFYSPPPPSPHDSTIKLGSYRKSVINLITLSWSLQSMTTMGELIENCIYKIFALFYGMFNWMKWSEFSGSLMWFPWMHVKWLILSLGSSSASLLTPHLTPLDFCFHEKWWLSWTVTCSQIMQMLETEKLSETRRSSNQIITERFVIRSHQQDTQRAWQKVYELQIWQLKWQNTRRTSESHSKLENHLPTTNKARRMQDFSTISW